MGKQKIKNQIRRLRFDANEMTQEELAKKAGVTRQTIIALEAQKYSPSLELAFRIAKVFDVPLEEGDINKIKPLLIDQITSRVRWRESVNYMIKEGVNDFLEIGPGKVLSGLVKKINRDVNISNINVIEDIK